jgi:DNA-binding NtrC family response regulator
MREAMMDRRCPTLSGLRLLIIDDDDDFRAVVSRRLRQLGADVREDNRIGPVRETISDWTPHVAVLDTHLPDGDGRLLGGLLLEELPELKLIFLTGDTQALATGSDPSDRVWHLLKPVSLEQLQRTIQQASQGALPAAPGTLAPAIFGG